MPGIQTGGSDLNLCQWLPKSLEGCQNFGKKKTLPIKKESGGKKLEHKLLQMFHNITSFCS